VRIIAALAVALAFAVACGQPHDDLPVTPGGGTGASGGQGSGSDIDAAVDALNTDGAIAGRVCLAADARLLETCAASGVDGLTVTLGTGSATTGSDGSFLLFAPEASDLVWSVSGSAIVPSLMPFGPSAIIPALSQTTYQDLTDVNLVPSVTGQGAMFVQVLESGSPLAGAVAGASPAAAYATYYDGNSSTQWNEDLTGMYGVAWIPGITAGSATVTVTPPTTGSGSGSAVTLSAPVVSGTLTFVTASITPL
jgi:hypothetical protein